jgi:hypothetical protein
MLGFVVLSVAGCAASPSAPTQGGPAAVAGRKGAPPTPTLTVPPPTVPPTAEPTGVPTAKTPTPPPGASFSARLGATPDASALARMAGLLSFGLGIGLWLATPPTRKPRS